MSGSATTVPTYNANGFLGQDPGVARFYDNVQAQVPGVPLPLLQMALWNTIQDFYQQSTSRRELVEWTMAPGVQEVDFNPYDETWQVAWILSVRGGLFRPKIIPGGVLRDLENPTSQRCGRALLALKPFAFQATFPEELYNQWFETILSGTLFRLYVQPAKPWTSPEAAKFHGALYRRGVAQARDIAQREWTDGPGRWRYPYFARGHAKP